MTITLPDELSEKLTREARSRRVSVQSLVTELVTAGLDNTSQMNVDDSLESVVARIRSMPPSHASMSPATHSLRDLLASASEPEQPLNVDQWNRQWAAIEAEMNVEAKADEIKTLRQMSDDRLSS